jgi:uncharacterized protein
MDRLNEEDDDLYLEDGQKVEERLESVDYDVWKCCTCNFHSIHPYKAWFSPHKDCPNCSYRTVVVTQNTVKEPTYHASGKAKVFSKCKNCKYKNVDTIILPQLVEVDYSSSSGGSGGGSSSGGGASGSW